MVKGVVHDFHQGLETRRVDFDGQDAPVLAKQVNEECLGLHAFPDLRKDFHLFLFRENSGALVHDVVIGEVLEEFNDLLIPKMIQEIGWKGVH